MQVPGLQFGSGVVLAAPQLLVGNPATNPTPQGYGVLQNVKLTLGAEIKTLFGINQWAVDSAIGKRTIKGSMEFAQITNEILSQLYTGDSPAPGNVTTSTFPGESHTVPTDPAAQTVTVTNHTKTPLVDYGVTVVDTGAPLIAVTGTPAAGQYSVVLSTGVYTFDPAFSLSAADIYINYSWTVSATGSTLSVQPHPMGWGPIVGLNVVFPYEGGGIGFIVPNARLGKIDIATKLDDYAMYTTDFEGFAGASGVPFTSYQAY